jgi:ATP-dependent exoDNAse (exonuclease V) alpha subunit
MRGIAGGSYFSVKAVDWKENALTLYGRDGQDIKFIIPTCVRKLQVYRWEERTIATGDRIQFTIHDKKRSIANRALATIEALDATDAQIKFDTGRELSIPISKVRHVDLGYVSTSFSSQGATIPRVIVNIDSMRGELLVNREITLFRRDRD